MKKRKTFDEYCLSCINNGQPMVCLGCHTGVALALLKGKKPPHYINKETIEQNLRRGHERRT